MHSKRGNSSMFLVQEKTMNGYLFSNDKAILQPDVIHRFLSEDSYWAKGIPLQTVLNSIRYSACFGVYENRGKQVGFARMVTDYSVFGYFCDVFILPAHRGKGLATELMSFALSFNEVKTFRWLFLATRDAHGLYLRSGFSALDAPENYMLIKRDDIYKHGNNR